VLVSKNSGGNETYAKIEAARELQIPVVIIERPSEPSDHKYETVNDLLSAIDAWL
jgi:precorrin-6A/cobalt-precorrin-6A reductase